MSTDNSKPDCSTEPLKKSPEDELAELRARYEKGGWREITSFADALDALDWLRTHVGELHEAEGRTLHAGNYRNAADIAWQVANRWTFSMLPARPDLDRTMTMIEAFDYITQCRELFLDRSRPEYWDWRVTDSGVHGAQKFVEWHLDSMLIRWLSEHGAAPSAITAIANIKATAMEFAKFHSLWSAPHFDFPDYISVATYIHGVAANWLFPRPDPPTGIFSQMNLDAYARQLVDQLEQLPTPQVRSVADDTESSVPQPAVLQPATPLPTAPVPVAPPELADASAGACQRLITLVTNGPRALSSGMPTKSDQTSVIVRPVEDDAPDTLGLVNNPRDESAYRPANKILNDFPTLVPTMKALTKLLEQRPNIRRWKPSLQRLRIHLGDWQQYVDSQARSSTDEDGFLTDAEEIAKRTQEIREKKQGK